MKKLTNTLLLALPFFIGNAQTKNFIDQPYLEVSGSADTLVTPNEIFIKIVLGEKDTKDKIALEDLELKMVNALFALGIEVEKNLSTRDMASNYKTYLFRKKDILKSKDYILKVADANLAGKVFSSLEELGISNASIDQVDHSDLEKIKNRMRSKSVENGLERALALTIPLNQKIGTAIHIVEERGQGPGLDGRVLSEIVVTGYSKRAAASKEMPTIEFEKIEIQINTRITFILK
ncbi:MAG TPA: SIMPL domain-containing protein [Saprospiraceae bacterium]|nr:SIMPL domain-containing protein [Saprospiraceae bacterium]HNT20947.1 SIMPL domain-containing protein [Saprospiraceae bacterium]